MSLTATQREKRETLKQQRHELRVMIRFLDSEIDHLQDDSMSASAQLAGPGLDAVQKKHSMERGYLFGAAPGAYAEAIDLPGSRYAERRPPPLERPPSNASSVVSRSSVTTARRRHIPGGDRAASGNRSGLPWTPAELSDVRESLPAEKVAANVVQPPSSRAPSSSRQRSPQGFQLKPPILNPLDIVPKHIIEGFHQEGPNRPQPRPLTV